MGWLRDVRIDGEGGGGGGVWGCACAVVMAAAVWMGGAGGCAERVVRADGAWDAAFTRADGWNGGDIGHSIELGGGGESRGGRTLWLFGDSIFGPVRGEGGGARVGGENKMLRGAIGWHGVCEEAGKPPREMRFATTEEAGGVPAAAWIAPAPGLWPEGTWYWLMGDGAMVRGEDRGGGARKLVLFAAAMGASGNPDGVWNFRRVGGVIMTVENPDDEPTAWRVVQRVNPVVQSTARHGEAARASDSWGEAVVRWGEDERGGGAGMVYVFGVRSEASGVNHLLVARADDATLAMPERWRYWTGEEWSEDAGAAAPVASGLVSEFTVQRVRRAGVEELVLIQSEPWLGRKILARAASRPQGPWSEPKAVYEVERPAQDKRLMTYAAKGHAGLSRRGELLVSYVINSTDFGQVFADAGLYRPRFVDVPVEMLPAAPGTRGGR